MELVREQHARIEVAKEAETKAKEEAAKLAGSTRAGQNRAAALGNKPERRRSRLIFSLIRPHWSYPSQHTSKDATQLSNREILDNILMKQTEGNNNNSGPSGSGTNDPSGGEDAIKAALVSMMSKKCPLLIKEPKGREFNRTNTFRLNMGFTTNRRKLSIPTPTAKISEQEKSQVHETVVEDRRHAIEAAIVRVMKQRKTLDHQMLVMEVSRLCNPVFKPEPRQVKNRIEELISREFLAREDGSNNMYKYLA